MARTLAATWAPGDEVVVTRLDHDANIRPWVLAAEAVGATVRWADFDPATAELTEDDIAAVLSPRTRLVAVTAASNLLGTRPPVRAIADLAHAAGALVYVDGVHLTAHAPVARARARRRLLRLLALQVPRPALRCARAAIRRCSRRCTRHKLAPSTDDVPERFELGTLPYELLAGTTAAVDFLAGHRRRPRATARAAAGVDGRGRGPRGRAARPDRGGPRGAARRHRVLAGRAPHADLARRPRRSASRRPTRSWRSAGSTRPQAPSTRWRRRGGSGWVTPGALRIGLAPYVDDADVDRLLDAMAEFTGAQA